MKLAVAAERAGISTRSSDRKAALGQTLRQRILSMELAPGAVVDEAALGEEFGVSRPPVRELMRQMAAEGYIELEANRAARVSAMSYQCLSNFFLAAPLIYVATTKLAAANATQADVQELKMIQGQFRTAVETGDVNSRVFQNDQFHLAIGRMAHNAYLMPSLGRLLIDHARLAKTFYQPQDGRMRKDLKAAVQQHDAIIEAIECADGDAAEKVMRSHVDLSRRNMAMYVAPGEIEDPAEALTN